MNQELTSSWPTSTTIPAEIDEALDGARFTAVSGRRQVVATADGNGPLISIDFVGVALTRVRAVELAGQVVAAVNEAQAQARQTFLRMVVDRLGSLPAAGEEVRS